MGPPGFRLSIDSISFFEIKRVSRLRRKVHSENVGVWKDPTTTTTTAYSKVKQKTRDVRVEKFQPQEPQPRVKKRRDVKVEKFQPQPTSRLKSSNHNQRQG